MQIEESILSVELHFVILLHPAVFIDDIVVDFSPLNTVYYYHCMRLLICMSLVILQILSLV